MIYALVNSIKSKPRPKLIGYCPICGESLISRCGNYKIWHWSHKSNTQCDSWSEGETEWHLSWKVLFPEECREVVIINNNTHEKHIADIRTKNDLVIELQNSPISDDEIKTREIFYNKMIWIINGNNFGFTKQTFFMGLSGRNDGTHLIDYSDFGRSKVFLKWSRSSVPVFFDFNDPLLFWLRKYDEQNKHGVFQIVKVKDLVIKNGGIL